MEAMLKSDLIAELAQKRGIGAAQAEQVIETIFQSMTAALCEGERIEIRGLGSFYVKHYQAYDGRNPKTGAIVPIKPKRGVRFRTGKELAERVNHGKGEGEFAGSEPPADRK